MSLNYELYDGLIYKNLILPIIIFGAIIIVILFFIIISIKDKSFKSLKIPIALAILVCIVGMAVSFTPSILDITNDSYVIYEGEFYVEDYYIVNRGGPYILIKTDLESKSQRYNAVENHPGLEVKTQYSGYFIYGKNSKVIVEIKYTPIH